MNNVRATAVKILTQVLEQGFSLTDAFAVMLPRHPISSDHGLIKEICFGVLRWRTKLEEILKGYLQKPIRNKDQDIQILLMVGCYQLLYLHVHEHVAIFETVAAAQALKKDWARGLVNGLLRHIQRDKAVLLTREFKGLPQFSHPAWLLEKVKAVWPKDWQAILLANNEHPPLALRVQDRAGYLEQLKQQEILVTAHPLVPSAVLITEPKPITQLPGFFEGQIFAQDAAAQLAAYLLDLQPGQRVLDACAAPGGKTTHILQLEPKLAQVVAVDNSEKRILKVKENLARCRVQATLKIADAGNTGAWWDGQQFDRILLDAPCSATGVIRRHPDIKWLRRAEDIDPLVKIQQQLLQTLWPLLKPGGKLLYATCSILPEENQNNIKVFLDSQNDAKLEAMPESWGHNVEYGRQIFPGEHSMDGFYYCVLSKGEL